MTEHTPAWWALRSVVEDWHRAFCMSDHDHADEIDQKTTELYRAMADEVLA